MSEDEKPPADKPEEKEETQTAETGTAEEAPKTAGSEAKEETPMLDSDKTEDAKALPPEEDKGTKSLPPESGEKAKELPPDSKEKPEQIASDGREKKKALPAPKGTGLGAALKAMLSFFTIIRLDVGEKEAKAMERNFWAAPVIGFLNGLVAALVVVILILCDVSTLVIAAAALATVFVFSKFLHFDGLADFGDGMIVSSGKQEDHIRALKDSRVGAGGVGVALTVTLVSYACYADLGAYWLMGLALVAVLSAEVLAKNAQVAAAAYGKPGNGMAAGQVGSTDTDAAVKSTLLSALLLVVCYAIYWVAAELGDWNDDIGLVAVMMILGLVVSVLAGFLVAHVSNKTFGFVNGDVLGAANEISRALVLLVFCMTAGLWF